MIKKTPETVILLNFGCKDIQRLAKAVRAENIYTMVMPWTTPVERVMQEEPVGLIVCRDADAADHPSELGAFKAPHRQPSFPCRRFPKYLYPFLQNSWQD